MKAGGDLNRPALCLLFLLILCGQRTSSAQVIEPPVKHHADASSAIQVRAKPALWKVKGTHGLIFLFGTVHVMKKDVVWETAKVKDSLRSSDVLYLEVADVGDAGIKATQPLILQLGLDKEHPLSTKISKGDLQLLDAAAKSMGVPGEQMFEPMQPWLVFLTLSVLPSVQAGYDPASGIDKALATEAAEAHKPIKGFETIEEQVHLIADLPQVQQAELLHQTLVDLPKSVHQADEVVLDWTRGDVEKIAALDQDELKVKSPALYDKLLVKRNEHFADALAALLKDPATGTVFVGIGAAHLAGSDSVLKLLAARGFTAERIQ